MQYPLVTLHSQHEALALLDLGEKKAKVGRIESDRGQGKAPIPRPEVAAVPLKYSRESVHSHKCPKMEPA